MIRKLLIGALLLPAILFGEELSDIDVESLVLLANGLAMGEIISLVEMGNAQCLMSVPAIETLHLLLGQPTVAIIISEHRRSAMRGS